MTRRFRGRVFIVWSVCMLWLGTPPLMAATPAAAITTLRVDIWPEHDDPRVLIIYRGTLGADVPLPYTLTFSIPAGAEVHAAAYVREVRLLTAQHQTAQAGDRTQISLLVPVPDFQFEYYVDVLSPPPQRTFAVSVVLPLPVGSLEVSVEQPLRSSGFTLTPNPTGTSSVGDFTYYLYAAQPWPAGKAWTVRGAYRKEDSTPSLAPAAPQVTAPGPPTGGDVSVPWLLPAVVGLAAGIVGALLVGLFRRQSTGSGSRGGHRQDRQDDGASRRRYCANCGKRAGPRDRFCSNCGRPLPEG